MGVDGWCDGAGITSSTEASYLFLIVDLGPAALAVVQVGSLGHFSLVYHFSLLSPSLL